MCDVHQCVTVDYQQIANDNIANQIHRFAIDYGKFILIRVNFLHSRPSLFLYGLLLSLWCFSIFVKYMYYFQVSFNLKVILSVAKRTQNTVTVLL